jgi:uncharacterized protein (DUF427 family)
MSVRMQDWMMQGLGSLRYEPTERRVRVMVGDRQVVDTTRAALVWEPRRVVPSYAVPVSDLRADLVASSAPATVVPDGLLHPGIPFGAHSSAGEPADVLVGDRRLSGAGFRPYDADLAEHVMLDFTSFDAWFEEDVLLVAHPREPYHWVELLPSSRRVRFELDGVVLAESDRPTFVFETSLPTRYYLPREDVRVELAPSTRRTSCAYKGEASYYSVPGHADLAWTYPEPLAGMERLAGLIAFLDDHLDVFVDDRPRERPRTAVSAALLDELGVAP